MRLLKDLIKDSSTVWIYCEGEKLQDNFLKQAEAEGFQALNGQKPTELSRQHLYGINDDMTMGYLSNMIWCLSLQGHDKHIRIDYGKYIRDEEDYSCHKSRIKSVGFGDWNKML